MPTLDDMSDLGPPIPTNIGRLYIAFTALAFVAVTAYTSRPLPLRLLVTGLIASDIYLLLTMPDLMGHIAGFDPLIANFIVADLLRVIDLYFIRDDSKILAKKNDGGVVNGSDKRSDEKQKTSPKFLKMTAFQAFDYLIINHRNIGTPYAVRNIPTFSSSNPSYIPPRSKFLLRKFVTIFAAYLTLDLLTCQPAPDPGLYSRHQEFFFTRLNEVTWAEIKFRFLTNVNLWASTFLLIQYIYAIVACVCVGSFLYEPRDFPPLVGSLEHCYTVRNHWGKFWHQILQSPLTSNANALASLLLPKSYQKSLIARYTKNLTAFALSGFSHAVSPLGSTKGSQQIRGTIFFFPAQVMGIALEDFVIWAWGSSFRGKGDGKGKGKGGPKAWQRVVGYVWVLCWMSWCCPIWVYPTLRRGGEGMVPYSFIRGVGNVKEMWESEWGKDVPVV